MSYGRNMKHWTRAKTSKLKIILKKLIRKQLINFDNESCNHNPKVVLSESID